MQASFSVDALFAPQHMVRPVSHELIDQQMCMCDRESSLLDSLDYSGNTLAHTYTHGGKAIASVAAL